MREVEIVGVVRQAIEMLEEDKQKEVLALLRGLDNDIIESLKSLYECSILDEEERKQDEARMQSFIDQLNDGERISISVLQRKFCIGYNRAWKLADYMLMTGVLDYDSNYRWIIKKNAQG